MTKLNCGGQVVGNTAKVFPASFLRCDVYKLVWRPQSRKHMLWARVRDAHSRANGVTLSRVVGDDGFTDGDAQMLAQLVPYLAHALNAPVQTPAQSVNSGESAVVVVSASGKIEHESADGRRLLLLAAHSRLAPGAVDWYGDSLIVSLVRTILTRLNAVTIGRSTAPPVVVLHNPWGKFVFRAYVLASLGTGPIVLLIERHVPYRLS